MEWVCYKNDERVWEIGGIAMSIRNRYIKSKGETFGKMLTSYFFILCIPVLISILLYLYVYQIVEKQTETYSNNILGTIMKTCDYEVQILDNFLRQMRSDENICRLDDAETDYWNEAMVKKKLTSLYTTMQDNHVYCDTVFVYMRDKEKIISQKSSMDLKYFAGQFGMDEQEAGAILDEMAEEKEFSRSLYYQEQEYILFLKPLVNGVNISKNTVVGILIKTDGLEQKISSLDWDGNMSWMIVDENGAGIHGQNWNSKKQFDLDAIKKNAGLNLDGTDYLVSQVDSQICDWKYLLLTPEKFVSKSVQKIRYAILAGLLGTMVSGCALSWWMARKQYRPLEKLMGIFQGAENGRNEYEHIEKQVGLIRKKALEAEAEERKSKRRLRIHSLGKLLESAAGDFVDGGNIAGKFCSGKNLVLLYHMNKSTQEKLKNKKEEKKLNNYIIYNAFEEGVGEVFVQETFPYEEMVVSIINIPDETMDYSAKLEEISNKICSFIYEKFGFRVYVLEGELHQGLEGIHRSWIETCYAVSFSEKMDDCYIRYSDIKESAVYDYVYSIEIEERVLNAVRQGNETLAKTLIGKTLEEGFLSENVKAMELRNCVIYDIFGTLLKASEEQGIHVGKMPGLNQITEGSPLSEIQAYFGEIVEAICGELRRRNENSKEKGLGELVLDYVKENYMDPDLNISQIAQYFHMTPAWLSSSFKTQTGESLLNIIKKIRMEHALDFLEKGCSVSSTARMVGFREDTTFIRAFKGYYGMTPGQLKKTGKIQ